MVLARRRQVRDGSHRPVEVAQVVRVAVAEPVLPAEPHAAAGDPTVRAGKVSGGAERAEGVLARLRVTRLLVIQGVDGGRARRGAAQPRARTGTLIGCRHALLG